MAPSTHNNSHATLISRVEFMSKFYEGQGYAFAPFCFTDILENEDDERKAAETNGGPPEWPQD